MLAGVIGNYSLHLRPLCLFSQINEKDTSSDFTILGERLANEVDTFIQFNGVASVNHIRYMVESNTDSYSCLILCHLCF
jgi:hypothetical protein